jgi:hypothetical protein
LVESGHLPNAYDLLSIQASSLAAEIGHGCCALGQFHLLP